MLMSRSSVLILLGILTILAPFSGLPVSFRNLLAVVFGACVLGIGFALRARDVRTAQALTEPFFAPEPAQPSAPQEISPI